MSMDKVLPIDFSPLVSGEMDTPENQPISVEKFSGVLSDTAINHFERRKPLRHLNEVEEIDLLGESEARDWINEEYTFIARRTQIAIENELEKTPRYAKLVEERTKFVDAELENYKKEYMALRLRSSGAFGKDEKFNLSRQAQILLLEALRFLMFYPIHATATPIPAWIRMNIATALDDFFEQDESEKPAKVGRLDCAFAIQQGIIPKRTRTPSPWKKSSTVVSLAELLVKFYTTNDWAKTKTRPTTARGRKPIFLEAAELSGQTASSVARKYKEDEAFRSSLASAIHRIRNRNRSSRELRKLALQDLEADASKQNI